MQAFLRIRRAFKDIHNTGTATVAPVDPGTLAYIASRLDLPVGSDFATVLHKVKYLDSGPVRPLLTESAKTEKTENGREVKYFNKVIFMLPAESAGLGDMCPGATPECIGNCIDKTGRNKFTSAQLGKFKRTAFLYLAPEQFRTQVVSEIQKITRKCKRTMAAEALTPCETGAVTMGVAIRGDGTTDLGLAQWLSEAPEVDHDVVSFYDYTKMARRARTEWPNWHVTLSAKSLAHAVQIGAREGDRTNLAIVVKRKGSESRAAAIAAVQEVLTNGAPWWTGPIVNGDISDARFLDPQGALVLLFAKGPALKTGGEFVWEV